MARMDKRGAAPYSEWAEVLFLVILFIGLVLGVTAPNAFITYAIAFVGGLICGRWFVERSQKGRGPYTLIMAGFILGFVLGTFRGSRVVTVFWFALGWIGMMQAKKRGWFKDIMY